MFVSFVQRSLRFFLALVSVFVFYIMLGVETRSWWMDLNALSSRAGARDDFFCFAFGHIFGKWEDVKLCSWIYTWLCDWAWQRWELCFLSRWGGGFRIGRMRKEEGSCFVDTPSYNREGRVWWTDRQTDGGDWVNEWKKQNYNYDVWLIDEADVNWVSGLRN